MTTLSVYPGNGQGAPQTTTDVAQIASTPKAIGVQFERWIDEARKVTALKALQGMIWEAGYRNGDFTGHIYEDAVRNLRAWHEVGIKLYVFSSGSVQAQKLLFGHSDAGDLTPLFSDYFDTAAAHRQVSDFDEIDLG